MKKLIGLCMISLLLLGRSVHAQGQVPTVGAPNPKTFTGAPTGTCGPQDTAVNTTTGDFYSCNAGSWLKVNGSGGGGGLADPGSNGIIKRTALNTTAVATATDIIGTFSSCSGTQYLGADAACHNAGGSGTVNSGTAGQVTYYAGTGTAVSGNANLTTDAGGDIFVKGGDPWFDVKANNAKMDGSTDDSTAFNNTLALCGANGGVIHSPAGTMALKGATSVLMAGTNCTLVSDPKTIYQAQTGASGCMINITGSGTLSILGGVWDANNIAASAICVNPTNGANVILDGNGGQIEIKNCTGNCISGGSSKPQGRIGITIRNFNIHDTPNNGWFFGTDANLLAEYGKVTNVGSNNNSPGVICSYCHSVTVRRVDFTNCGNGDGCLYALGIDHGSWTDDTFEKAAGATHCDTCHDLLVAHDHAHNSGCDSAHRNLGGDWFEEASSEVTISDVSSNDDCINAPGGYAITTGAAGSIASARVQEDALSSTTGIVASANVTVSTVSNFPATGVTGVAVNTNSSFTTGTIIYKNFAAPLTGTSVKPYWSIWAASNGVSGGQLNLIISNSTNLATQDVVLPLPAFGGTNNRLYLYGEGWQAAGGSGTSGYQSWGITCTAVTGYATSCASLNLDIQDLETSNEMTNNRIIGNNIRRGAAGCILVRQQQGGSIEDNYCYYAGNIVVADSWPPVTFRGNQMYYPCCNANLVTVDSTNNGPGLSGIYDQGGNWSITQNTTAGTTTGFVINPLLYSLTNGGIRLSSNGNGGTPTCTFTSGGGTSPSCSIAAGSTDEAGTIILNTGTGSPAATGTVTLTFSAPFGTNPPDCLWTLSQAGAGQWSFRGSILDTTPTTASDIQTFDNNGFVLSTSTAYRINYRCFAK